MGQFIVSLIAKELGLFVVLGHRIASIVCNGVVGRNVRERPEPFTEGPKERSNKRAVRVSCEELLQAVNIDWCDDFKEVRVRIDSLGDNRIGSDRKGRRRKGSGDLSPFRSA